MLDVTPVRAAVVRCFGAPHVLDAFPAAGATLARVAPDELWLLGSASTRTEMTQRAKAYLAGADPDGTVADQSDGWAVWTVTGARAAVALARLSSIEVPRNRPAFVQGAVAEVPAKVLVEADRLHLIAPAQFAHHVAARIADACADLEVRLGNPGEIVLERTP